MKISYYSLLIAGVLPLSLSANILWDETVDGDFSGNFNNPDFLTVVPGLNTINNISVTGNRADLDFFTLNVPAGLQVVSIYSDNYTSSSPTNGGSFLGWQNSNPTASPVSNSTGGILSEAPTGSFAGFIDFHVINDTDDGVNLWDQVAFYFWDGSLPSGQHPFWMQETAGGVTNTYDLNFEVQGTPEPSAAFGGLLVGASLLLRRRRR